MEEVGLMRGNVDFYFDVRPDVDRQEDPFLKIMHAADKLEPGQALVIVSAFQPRLLFKALERKRLTYTARPHEGGAWRITVTRPDCHTSGPSLHSTMAK